jgi:hypothetical protein
MATSSTTVSISSIVGSQPFDIYLSDTGHTTWYYITRITGTSYSFVLQPPFENLSPVSIKIVDANGCQTIEDQ